MKMEQCSETSAIEHRTPENTPKDYTRHSEHGESLKSRNNKFVNLTVNCSTPCLNQFRCALVTASVLVIEFYSYVELNYILIS
jgi:hypothetical protein